MIVLEKSNLKIDLAKKPLEKVILERPIKQRTNPVKSKSWRLSYIDTPLFSRAKMSYLTE